MKDRVRRRVVVLVFVLAVAVAVTPAFAVAEETNGDDEVELSFGEEVSVMASQQQSRMVHEVEDRAFEHALERGDQAFEERVERLRGRLDHVESRMEEVDEAKQAGEISERRAAAKKAKLGTEARSTSRSADRMLDLARGRGLNVTAVNELKMRAAEMPSSEVPRVARNIAAGPPERVDTGPPEPAESREESGAAGNDDKHDDGADPGPSADVGPTGDERSDDADDSRGSRRSRSP